MYLITINNPIIPRPGRIRKPVRVGSTHPPNVPIFHGSTNDLIYFVGEGFPLPLGSPRLGFHPRKPNEIRSAIPGGQTPPLRFDKLPYYVDGGTNLYGRGRPARMNRTNPFRTPGGQTPPLRSANE